MSSFLAERRAPVSSHSSRTAVALAVSLAVGSTLIASPTHAQTRPVDADVTVNIGGVPVSVGSAVNVFQGLSSRIDDRRAEREQSKPGESGPNQPKPERPKPERPKPERPKPEPPQPGTPDDPETPDPSSRLSSEMTDIAEDSRLSSKYSPGEIVGIVIGVLAALGVVAAPFLLGVIHIDF